MKKIIYLLVGIVLFGGLYYSCAPEELPGSIYGTVVDKATGEPIKSAGVELSPSGLKTVTGSEGQFEFTELDPGKYTLIITKTGYVDGVSGTIEVKPGQQAKGDVQIEKLPPALKVVDDNRQEISTLDFGSAEDDVARSFSVFNDGTETLEWELTATADWIKSVSKTTGTLSAGATQAIIITIDRAKLSSGENKTTVHITSNSGNKQLVVTATNNYQPTTLNTLPATDIKSNYAVLHGEILTEGTPKYTERGFVYSESTKPTIENCIQQLTTPLTDEKVFTIEVTGLIEGKTYYVRAYAINGGKEVYSSNEVSFTPVGTTLPKVATKSVTDILRAEGKATVLGEIQELGDPAYSERGFVYGTTNDLSIANGTKVEVKNDGNSEYSAVLSDLALGHLYYIRAYAINTVGVAYGEELSADFTPIKPAVTTNDVTAITDDGKATFNATITNVGDPVYSERGFVYGKSTNPLIGSAEQLPVAGTGDGAYYKNVEGLDANIPYYVRAYLIYSQGTIYGEEKTFTIQKTFAPTVVTTSVSNISYTSATTGGVVTSDGGENVTERGVVYSTTENPTIDNTKISNGVGTGTFSCELTELKEGVTYYVRAYAINAKGTAYGEEVSFTTKTKTIATIATTPATNVSYTSATVGGNVTDNGGATVTERGICYSTSANPTTANTKITSGSGLGQFTCNLTNLQDGTTYYVRAYAINEKGTAYGEEVSFTTKQLFTPTIVTTQPTNVAYNSATVGGNVTDDGGASVTERGVVYGTSQNPTVADNKVSSGNGKGAFTCNLTNLKEATTYFVRAYAINEKGTAYGEEVSFTTSKEILLPSVTTSAVTQITETTAVAGGNVTSDGGASVSERGVVYSLSANPAITDLSSTIVRSGNGTGAFTCNLSNLQAGTTYYVRAYAINSKGTAYGDEISFTTALPITLAIVTTASITQITETTAVAGGTVTNDGNASVTERGVVYSTTENPTIDNTKISNGVGTGTFSCELTELKEGVTYYVRAYAINARGVSYGEQVSFTTKTQLLATLTTNEVTEITETTAVTGGEVTSDGGATVTERGVVYSTSQNPTTSSSKIVNGSGVGSFICNLTNLKPNTTYYVRAYATNSKGTAYGTQVAFTTLQIYPPTLTTTEATEVTETTAVVGGNVTDDGGASVTERGVVYSTSQNPTTSNGKVTSGSGLGAFVCNLKNLKSSTTYYARAYAKNTKGTSYGEQVTFTTKRIIVVPTVTTMEVTQITTTTAVAAGEVTDNGGADVVERGVVYSTSENPTTENSKVIGGSGTGMFTCNLTGLQPLTIYYIRAYAINSKGVAYGMEQTFATRTLPSGSENGHDYVDLGLSVKWATYNVGASSSEDYGDYFAWGETEPKEVYYWSTYKWCNGSYYSLTKYNTSRSFGTVVDNKMQLELSDDVVVINWGGSWRMPTDAELTELREQCTWTWTSQNGVNGYKVTSKSNGNSIFLPAAGYRYGSSLYEIGYDGYYLSSSLNTDEPYDAWRLHFESSDVYRVSSQSRYYGFTVRPVCP